MEPINDKKKGIQPRVDLLVIKAVDEGGEAPGLVLHGKRQPGNVPNKHGVEVSGHFQVVAGTQGLGNTQSGSTGATVDAAFCRTGLPRKRILHNKLSC